LQEFRSSGVQEFRSSGVQEFRSSGGIVDGKTKIKPQIESKDIVTTEGKTQKAERGASAFLAPPASGS